MNKLLIGLKSPGNWAILLASGIAGVQQVRPCLVGKAATIADGALAATAAIGVIWNTLHLQKNLLTPAVQPTFDTTTDSTTETK